jgi:hypothetical protein
VQTRIYLPVTPTGLRRLGDGGSLEPPPFTAYAVTTDLRREHPTADDEELEYLAFAHAAASRTAPASRVVAAADVDADVVTDLLDPAAPVSAVQVAAVVPRRQVASFLVADASSSAADGQLPDYSWYDATELEVVIDVLR